MNKKIKTIIKKLGEENKTISTMESCTGGAAVNAITNIPGASRIIKYSAITYSNEYKIKMGVPKEIIDKYSVYSKETAKAMAKAISDFAKSDYGIGITGKLRMSDSNNPEGEDDKVFVCIYDREKEIYHDLSVKVNSEDRKNDKIEVLEALFSYLEENV